MYNQYEYDNIYLPKKSSTANNLFIVANKLKYIFVISLVLLFVFNKNIVRADDDKNQIEVVELMNVRTKHHDNKLTQTEYFDDNVYKFSSTLTSLEELDKLHQTKINSLENEKTKTITDLNDIHNKRLTSEEQYFETIQKLSEHYELLKTHFILSTELKELEEKMRHIKENLNKNNNLLLESDKTSTSVINSKTLSDETSIEHEKLVLKHQNNMIKKLTT